MRYSRRLIATLTALPIWIVAAATVAYAQQPIEPLGGGGRGAGTPSDTSNWRYVLIAAIAAVLTVAVVGLVASLRHSRSSHPTPMAHA